jgi:hypothetical protein
MNMTEFKIKYIIKLGDIEKELLIKYPDKKERIVSLCNLVESKLENLQLYNMHDYLATIFHAKQEFPEIWELWPWDYEVEQLIKNK